MEPEDTRDSWAVDIVALAEAAIAMLVFFAVDAFVGHVFADAALFCAYALSQRKLACIALSKRGRGDGKEEAA